MGESRTPRSVIFDPFWVYLEAAQDAQKADALFVTHRLKSLALLPELGSDAGFMKALAFLDSGYT
jgi:hypothetical protein